MKKQHQNIIVFEIMLHLLFWAVLIYIFNSSFTLKYAKVELISGKRQIVTYTRSLLPYILIVVTLKSVFIYSLLWGLLPKYFSRLSKLKGAFLTTAALLLLLACEYALLYVLTAISGLTVTEAKMVFPVNIIFSVLCTGVALAYYFIQQWNQSQQRVQFLTSQQLVSELNLLKAQIAPHFLFNTLNNFFSLAQKEGNEKLAGKIAVLSGFMRYLLNANKTGKITLKTELDFINNYIEIMKMNYPDDDIEIRFDVSSFPENTTIIPMMLIPFVENAFKYGVKPSHKSVIYFSLKLSDGMIIFSGTNPDYSAENKNGLNSFGIGLDSVSQKAELYYKGKGTAEYGNTNGIFSFILKIPAFV